MSPSSKWSQQRGHHRTPRICHPPPPPPPIIPPPPPPLCPPSAIGGWLDLTFGFDLPYDEYFSAYNATPKPDDPNDFTHGTPPSDAYHHIRIYLTDGGPTLSIELELYWLGNPAIIWGRDNLPFTWCVHNNLICANWDLVPAEHVDAVVKLTW